MKLPDDRLGIPSAVTGLVAHIEDGRLRWFDPAAGVELPTYDEAENRRQAAEERVAELEARLQERGQPP